MIYLGTKICDWCEEKAGKLFLFEHTDKYNKIRKHALCLDCIKNELKHEAEGTCEDCREHAAVLFKVNGSFYCAECLEAHLHAFNGHVTDEEDLRAEYDNQKYDEWKGEQ